MDRRLRAQSGGQRVEVDAREERPRVTDALRGVDELLRGLRFGEADADGGPQHQQGARVPTSQRPEAQLREPGQLRAALAPYQEIVTIKEMQSREGRINADITLKGVTKATGLLELARLRQIPISEIIAVGDDHNDLEMLAESWGVAMGNAVPEAKAMAKLVINHTDTDGLAEFILAVLAARKHANSTS